MPGLYEILHTLLAGAVRNGDPFVLAQVLLPGGNHEALDVVQGPIELAPDPP
jgi:hypothetical protein